LTSATEGQELALRQLQSIALASTHGVDILDVQEPQPGGSITVEVSIDCAGVDTRAGGIVVHGRERFDVRVPPDFPYDHPNVTTRHARWAGTPHVQWRRQPCLYLAPTVEWLPADGMYGYIDRLFSWIEHAAAGELDPDDAPLHPPVAYTTPGAPLVIPRVDAPSVGAEPWLGSASLDHPHARRYDITGWVPDLDGNGQLINPPRGAAAAVLTPFALDFEYPRTVHGLVTALDDRDLPLGRLLTHLGWVAAFRQPGDPLLVILGTAMRRAADGTPRQHLTAWRIASEHADHLTDAVSRYSSDERRRELGEEALKDVVDWIVDADVEWCPVREDRPELVERRDSQSPMQCFVGKRVAIWGCGALGGPIAEAVVRAGASQVILYDNASVHPGVLVRQPLLDEDLGRAKATVLADRLRRIFPATGVSAHVDDVLTGPLGRTDWHDGSEIVIDATASTAVQSKLERARRRHPQNVTIITVLVGHTAEHGLATVARPSHSGAGADTLRATKLGCTRSARLAGFLDEFWPAPPRTEHFQPEPGCSSPTFRGSGAEATALAGMLLTAAATELAEGADESSTAAAHLVALPTARHQGTRAARLELPCAIVMSDAHRKFELRVGQAAAAQVRACVESARRRLGPDPETGGVLFGERDDATGVIWIDEATGPPPDSVESPDLFLCGTEGVRDLDQSKRTRTSGTSGFVGMWHTHPRQSADFSSRDLRGMLELLDASESPRAQGVIVIVGWGATQPELGAYVFEREELRRDQATISAQQPAPLPVRPAPQRDIGLALSGGGSRAIAFHLGCLRNLHDRGVLDRVRVISGVSGGSVMTALWAYADDDFDAFDDRVQELLRRGLARGVARRALLSPRAPQALVSSLAAATRMGPRRVSRTDVLRDVLAERVCGDLRMGDARRGNIDVVINACDLRTGSAFRFGSVESGTWRYGTITGNEVDVATAVAASAAYPVLLPALDRSWEFERRDGAREVRRVVLTDGGVFDNLGTSCLEPGRSASFSTNVHAVDYVIACDAGQGLFGARTPAMWPSRMKRSFETSFRKVQDGARGRLHQALDAGELRGFLLPYLGQQDSSLVDPPADLVPREAVMDYPTNFSAMSADDLARLAKRGEQLTRVAIDTYLPEL
jgi:predicted acylesterase/phospholipase RssA/molybdopterin/thiamine biosynthesis adenylyltransferase